MFAIIHVPRNLRPLACQIGARVMQGKVREKWMQLCELAVVEQDPEKLMALITEINRILDEKDRRLKRVHARESSNASSKT